MSPSLVNWMTSMMTMRLQVVLEHLPLTSTNIQQYIILTQVLTSPVYPWWCCPTTFFFPACPSTQPLLAATVNNAVDCVS